MIIYEVGNLKIYETRSDKPKTDWTGKAKYVIDETNKYKAELIRKIKEYAPSFDYVLDGDNELVDIVKTDNFEPEIPKTPIEILAEENAVLKDKIATLTESNAMLEECIVEMAGVIYA